jgi:AraC-like DNA-binding protein
VNTLQRHFRAMWGTTVAQYLREGRLSRARLALERDGISVAQAACIAGYGSAANFATAFRRRFGVPPGQVRARR